MDPITPPTIDTTHTDTAHTKKCRLVAAVNYVNGAYYDSIVYNYTDTAVTSFTDYYNDSNPGSFVINLISAAGHITNINYTNVTWMLEVLYNVDGTIKQLNRYRNADVSPNYTEAWKFQYMNAKLVQVDEVASAAIGSAVVGRVLYMYSGNNVTHTRIIRDNVDPQDSLSEYDYTYDSTPNALATIRNRLRFTDPTFFDGEMNFNVYAFLISENNLTSIKIENQSLPVTRQLDADKNLTAVLFGGEKLMGYYYKCN